MNLKNLFSALAIGIIALTLTACTSSDDSNMHSPATSLQGGTSEDSSGSCPAMPVGAQVGVIDVEDGVALEFTTSGDVEVLRLAVERMAQMHNAMHRGANDSTGFGDDHAGHHKASTMPGDMMGSGHMGGGHGQGSETGGMGEGHMDGDEEMDSCMGNQGGMGMGHGMGMGSMMMPAATVTVENIDGGARMIFVPVDPSDLDALRAHFREHMGASGGCPMMSRNG